MNNKENGYTLYLSERAQRDYKKIQRYTRDVHGKEQVLKYAALLKGCLETITDNPMLGHWRSDIPQTHKAYNAGEHIIVYRVVAQTVYVVAILHSRMDFSRHLEE
ncbi:type II toxin-antitoxin system RelE/ParE family toxin [Aetokthonos hydrillicola Thurmond2011]|jgi:toxin ParE1/3/4|uniref:Toxin n=1 Tax=Aetokthonos hydrillicola Thurmond2011 TaxID=2712845 RepID=A0AAP5IDZ3_9CYAN|nr:type II toxin-antitoxin system RelE/ParE family toxin [Aetokthonos hydrillicola]MBO3463052.1 type II toxin-antitoxin system RelE/ParE family toxin [Aetokthonos hydrillicola CCALA 1050]MBW4588901.1 type II toxin-antitoxin system RelE/ParE family toxin [Aetokthonos hydrillicola CCALA 1050]MDR9898272.1 type II toxin-antitoxin system RelE/ParE family toxin [Aetokthonos hydrillicola Thurmond2011]